MARKGWYLIAYDISDPKRLVKIHRLIKKQGVSAQQSLFFVYDTVDGINQLLDELNRLMKESADDLRAYPVRSPDTVWAFGVNPLADLPIINLEKVERGRRKKKNKTRNWLKRFLGI